METQLFIGEKVFTALAAEWDGLAGRGMTNTPFQRLAYQRAWWRHLGPGNLYTLGVRDGGGELVAVAPFYLVDDVLYLNGCVEETDYLDLIAPPEWAKPAWQAIFNCLDSNGFPSWTTLDLCNIPAASLTRTILPPLAQSRGFLFSSEVHDVCPVIELPATFDDYLAQLDKKQRHEIRRKLRRAEESGVTMTAVQAGDDVHSAVEEFLGLLRTSTPEKEAWLNNGRQAVFHEVADAALAEGMLQLLFLVIEGQPAATLFNFDYDNRIWVYNSGLDPAAFGHLSAGVVLTARAIEQAIVSGRQFFDFLRGDEIYKYRFGAKDTTVHRLVLSRPQ
ncbi:MAG: GNAT family N-acetyltransferase [Chloroflexi bacterium]|nr:GNAT family N-acetyltransferase [Chloroflexota bacterium]MCI0578608.1 GNAT family N-acetyltransferase [Chloroflexota bacterium]MCI0647367.1 GNAT family N-acetyltransferase [Chloroflexota bacterium]MCI0727827.1 GNAT family N-acetyltransferase [Chloroflexota bacterium]